MVATGLIGTGAEPSKRYKKISFLGEGQFATVYRAEDTHQDGKIVAVKKIKLGHRSEAKDGINRTALREIKILQELSHPNVVALVDVFGHKSSISLVFEYMTTDLEVVVRDSNVVLAPADVKSMLMMTITGVEYLHDNWILHRDLKPNNLLMDERGNVKLHDFGLARQFGSPSRTYTHQVVTRWYRAPELLFGARNYGGGIDMWAIGCILAELLLRAPFLPAESDLGQLAKIFETLGTPTDDTWPGLRSLSDFVEFKHFPRIPLGDIFSAAGDDLLALLDGLFAYDPLRRLSATAALQHEYFSNRPAPTPPHSLPRPGGGDAEDAAGKKPVAAATLVMKRKLNEDPLGDFTAKRLIF